MVSKRLLSMCNEDESVIVGSPCQLRDVTHISTRKKHC